MLDARADQVLRRDHAAHAGRGDGGRRLPGHRRGAEARRPRERDRRAGEQAALRDGLGPGRGGQRDLRRALQPAPAQLLRPADPARATRRSSTSSTPTTATGPATTGRSASAARPRASATPTRRPGSGWTPPSAWSSPVSAPTRSPRSGPRPTEFGFENEMAAFGLQFGHGLGLGLHERPIISRLNSMTEPVELQPGHGLRPRDLLPGERRLLRGPDRGGGRRHRRRPARSSPCSPPRTWSSPTPTEPPGPFRSKGLRMVSHPRRRRCIESLPDCSPTCTSAASSSRPRTADASTSSTRPPSDVVASVADGTVATTPSPRSTPPTRPPRRGPRRPRASGPRSCGGRSSSMTDRAEHAGPADHAGERQGARATPGARSPTPPSSSAGTPRRRSVAPASLVDRASGERTRSSWSSSRSASACWSRPWNFPAAMATRKIAPGAGRRLHRRAQARQRHPADRAGAGDRSSRTQGCRRASSTSCPRAAREPWSRRCCTTRGSASCRSPAAPRSAGCCCARPPTR